MTQKEYDKLKEDEHSVCSPFELNGEGVYFQPKKLGKSYIVRHNGDAVPVKEFFSARLFTDEVLHELDEKIIKPTFGFPETQDGINELETDELDELADFDNED